MAVMTRRKSDMNVESKLSMRKRKRVEEEDEDSEIDSDDAGLSSDGEREPMEQPDVEAEDENETVEEKRLRLARDYLRQLGVDDEAELDDDSDDNSEEDNDGINAKLRKSALRETKRITTHLADSISGCIANAKITACRGHSLPATCIALACADDTVAVSGGKDSRVIVWDVNTATRKHSFKANDEWKYKKNPGKASGHIGNILSVAVSDDGQIAASGGLDGLVRIWDVRAPKLVDSLRGHRGPVQGLAFRNGTRQLFSASSDRSVKIWDLNDMAYVDTLFGHGGDVQCVDCLEREKPVSCGQDGSIRLYKVVEGTQLVFKQRLTMSIDCVSMVNNKQFVSGGNDCSLSLWFTNNKKPVYSINKAHGSGTEADTWISSVKAVPFSDLAISGSGDGKLRFWKCVEKPTPSLATCGELDLGIGFVNGIDVNSNGSLLVAAVGSEHRLGRWSRIRKSKNGIRIVKLDQSN